MNALVLSHIARWTESRLLGADVQINSVSTDTRSLQPGGLFIALKGEHFDGHDFVEQAQAVGASALLVSQPVTSNLPQVLCADTQEALGEIAAAVQKQRRTVLLSLTGSNGKTTVKTLLHNILSLTGSCYANPGNFNNEIGLPLAVLQAPDDAQFGIYEMGAGKPGDIAYLCSIVQPTVALVNNIAPAHIERMHSLFGIAETKGAIYEALCDDGIGIVNADDAFAAYFMQRIGSRRSLRFGIDNDADVWASKIQQQVESVSFCLHIPGAQADITLQIPGRHSVLNALAASAMALAAGASIDHIGDGLRSAKAVSGRLKIHKLVNGGILIDDAYNANPGSVAAAISTLSQNNINAWLVLGDMAELGPDAESLHKQIGTFALVSGINKLLTVGTLSKTASKAFGKNAIHFSNQAELIQYLKAEINADVHCLIKGSRSSAMDRVVKALLSDSNTMENNCVA